MARITLDVPDAAVPRIAAALGYRGDADDGPLGPFVKRHLVEYVRAQVARHEGATAAETAREAARQQAGEDITIT